jgi:hypothetical protein
VMQPAVVLSGRRLDAGEPGFRGGMRAVALCCFRLCDWSSDEVPTAPVEVADELIARHLLEAHRDAVTVIGRLAQDTDLIP